VYVHIRPASYDCVNSQKEFSPNVDQQKVK